MALGIAASGNGTGSILFPLVFQHLQPIVGFSRAVQAQGYIAILFAVIINLLLRPRLPPRRAVPLLELKALLWANLYPLYSRRVPHFLGPILLLFLINIYATTIIDLYPKAAVNLLVVISAVNIPVQPLLGFAADWYFGALPALIVSSAWLGIMLYVWIPIHNVGGLYVWSVFYGLAPGATQGS
jgi:hypothetical protein